MAAGCGTLLTVVLWVGLFVAAVRADYTANFDVSGNGKFELQQNTANPPPPHLTNDVGGTNMFLRLNAAVSQNINSFTYDINDGALGFGSDLGAHNEIIADFDFRIAGTGDGFGFILFDTAIYGRKEIVPRLGFQGVQVYHEPTATNSLGIGFDVHQGTEGRIETNDNHISIHFDTELLAEFDVGTNVNLNSGDWIHAKITVRPGSGNSSVSVALTPTGGSPVIVVTNFNIGGMIPYENRPHFGGRSGTFDTSTIDLDNINIQYNDPVPVSFGFGFTNFTTVESDPAYVYVVKNGGNNAPISVDFLITNGTAIAGTDFVATNGTLTFDPSEPIKRIPLAILDRPGVQATRSFSVVLTNATDGASITQSSVPVYIHDDDDPAVVGQWDTNIVQFPAHATDQNGSAIVSIHLNLLPNGKLLMWDRHGVNPQATDGDPRLWDPVTGIFSATPKLNYDLFCAGHTLMADGRLFVPGGHILDGVGHTNAAIYDPVSNIWTQVDAMNAGRWYPTATVLANGNILVEAGTIDIPTDVNKLSQIWDIASWSWRGLTNAELQHGRFPIWANYYPFMYQAPNGKVFCAGPQQVSRYLDTAGLGNWEDVASSSLNYRDYGTSALYDDGKVMITGGNPPETYSTISLLGSTATVFPSRTTEVIDLNSTNPVWRISAPMNIGRRHATATLLPDGNVIATGGSSSPGFNIAAGAARWAEVWNPTNETWTPMAAAQRYNGYHANALLLPDGRVVTTGGGHPNPADAPEEPTAEIYSPYYLFKGARPSITSAPDKVTFGETFYVETSDATNIATVSWIKIGNTTHAFNQSQRRNFLSFTNDGTGLWVTAPANPYLCTPGHYMMFFLNSNGVPSVASIVQVAMGILSVEPQGNDNVITITTVPDNNYQLEYSDAIPGTNWMTVGSAVAATNFTSSITNAGGALALSRFYRVRQIP